MFFLDGRYQRNGPSLGVPNGGDARVVDVEAGLLTVTGW